MTISKNNKMLAHIGYRMKVVVLDRRTFMGYFKAFDKHMNVILSDCEEIRRIKPKPGQKLSNEEEKRILGLVLLRGHEIVSISVDGPPQKDDDAAKLPRAGGHGGPGSASAASRSMPPMGHSSGLHGDVRGAGGPGYDSMHPRY